MNWPTLVLVVLIALLQYPLWLGKGGWLRVWDYDRQLQAQREHNQTLEQRNAALDADVRDLKSGYEAIEERARYELGMIKEGRRDLRPGATEDAVGADPDSDTAARRSSQIV